jgi:hypothetical protein
MNIIIGAGVVYLLFGLMLAYLSTSNRGYDQTIDAYFEETYLTVGKEIKEKYSKETLRKVFEAMTLSAIVLLWIFMFISMIAAKK